MTIVGEAMEPIGEFIGERISSEIFDLKIVPPVTATVTKKRM